MQAFFDSFEPAEHAEAVREVIDEFSKCHDGECTDPGTFIAVASGLKASGKLKYSRAADDLSPYTALLVHALESGAAATGDEKNVTTGSLHEYIEQNLQVEGMKPDIQARKAGQNLVLAHAPGEDFTRNWWRPTPATVTWSPAASWAMTSRPSPANSLTPPSARSKTTTANASCASAIHAELGEAEEQAAPLVDALRNKQQTARMVANP